MKQKVVLINEGEKNIASIYSVIDELVPPLKLARDPSLMIPDEEPKQLNPPRLNRKKAEILEYQEPQDQQAHSEEKIPWLLEDSEQRSFIGTRMQNKITEDHQCAYYAMVREKNETKLYKIKNWYKFSQRIQYETLTLEQAEEQMHKRPKDQYSKHTERYRSRPEEDKEDKEDELEYKEKFDDDDGEIEIEQPRQKKKKKLDSSGKNLKKIVKCYEPNDSEESNEPSSETFHTQKPQDAQEITEPEVKMCLYKGPVTIKALIEGFKARLKANPQNKEILRALIKRICIIKTNPSTQEKLLVLKENSTADK
ncbi:hypothetical protein NEOKW01_0074 [Nematocida sp. AWRm80]|nr:hypothetical protein NEOKW01_0074 [Nematocida sp. AWRm80]